MPITELEKLAPFMLKAGVIVVGRERIIASRARLAFIIITKDISDSSREQAVRNFKCPVYQCLTMQEVATLFHFNGTKMLGFRRSSLAANVQKSLKPFRVTMTYNTTQHFSRPLSDSPTVAILGASGIGRHHCNWWSLEGARPVAFLGTSPESTATTLQTLKSICNFNGRPYTSLTELLEKENPDIVDVCLPPALHANAVRQALQAGSNVLCEKPFVYDDNIPHAQLLGQARELANLAAAKGLMLGVCTQYVMAVSECLRLLHDFKHKDTVESFTGTLVSPTRNRPPIPHWTWVDLAPHMLGVAQVLSSCGTLLKPTLKTHFQDYTAQASFDCKRPNGTILHCNIDTLHRDTPPKNLRQLTFDETLFDINGFKDDNGVFQMKITTDFASTQRPDMLRLLIRSFLHGKIEMPPKMAIQNLEWLLTIISRESKD